MTVRVDLVEARSDRDLADVARLETAYWREVLGDDEPDFPAGAVDQELLRTTRSDIQTTAVLARDGADAVGFGIIDIRTGAGNEHMAWLIDLFVEPAHRRNGVGSLVFEPLLEAARAADRTLVLGGFPEGHAAAEGFVARVGGHLGNRERQNRVRVADLDRAMLESWNRAPDGYSLVTFDGPCPDDLVGEVVRVKNVMNDAPKSDLLDDFSFTVEQRREWDAEIVRDGVDYWYVAACHDQTGELAGYTEIVNRPVKPWIVEQGDTAVAPTHRGHGIGRWVKAVNALRVLDERADALVLETWNDGSNRWMLDINTAMGFRPVATWVEVELKLD